MKFMRACAIAFVCLSSLIASATISVSGNLQDLSGSATVTGAIVRFYMRGCGGNQPFVSGTALISPTQGAIWYKDFTPNGSGAISGTLYASADVSCGGSTGVIWYGMVVIVSGKAGPEAAVSATANININNPNFLTTNPVVSAPTGDSTYLRLDGTNSPVTGTVQFNNGIRFLGATSGNTTLAASAIAFGLLTLPAVTDRLVATATTDTLTNKTLTSPVVTNPSTTGTDSGAETLQTKTINGANNTLSLRFQKQIFTSSGTFTIPTGVTSVKVTVLGGGGAGGGGVNAGAFGAGGGAGGCAIAYLTGLTPGNTLTVTVGAGGTGTATTGNPGGNSSISSGTQTISTVSGNGGGGGVSSAGLANGGTGGTASGGDLNFPGNYGSPTWNPGQGDGSPGGGSIFGGLIGAAGAVPFNAVGFGNGGGGAGNSGSTNNGGNGSQGIVIFEWIN